MPLIPLADLYRKSTAVPGEANPYLEGVAAPLIGSAERPTPLAQMLLTPFWHVDKVGHASLPAFFDELSKIAYVPNTRGDRAGVLRSLLMAMLGRKPYTADAGADAYVEQRLLYGDSSPNYSHAIQEQAAQMMLRDSRLQAAMSAGPGSIRTV